jgi:hypothetical protein
MHSVLPLKPGVTIGPFKIVERRGEVAYQLELPAQLLGVHVSQLKKCTSEVKIEPVQLEDIEMGNDLTYKEHPIKILDTSERVTRRKIIRMCKVQWSHHTEEEATWEREDELKELSPPRRLPLLLPPLPFLLPRPIARHRNHRLARPPPSSSPPA